MRAVTRIAVTALALTYVAVPAFAADPAIPVLQQSPAPLKIDIPVVLKDAKIVFNMSQLAFVGEQSVGLTHMKILVQRFKADQTTSKIIAVFHGQAGFMVLDDAAYNKARRTERGNPFKALIAELQQVGVEFEECGQTAKANNWTNADFLPGVKVNSGANLRLVELVQSGFIQLQP